MCGRFTISASPDAIRKLPAYEQRPNFPSRYNVAPTQPVPIERLEKGARHFARKQSVRIAVAIRSEHD